MSKQEEIREMAKLSLFSGRINEIQEKNLKMFPFVFFNGITSVTVRYDLSNKGGADYEEDKETMNIKYSINKSLGQSTVEYELEVDENADNSHLDKRFEALEKSVRQLFWKNIKVLVYFGQKLVYGDKNERKPASD